MKKGFYIDFGAVIQNFEQLNTQKLWKKWNLAQMVDLFFVWNFYLRIKEL